MDNLTQKEQKLFNKIQDEIRYCLYDQSNNGSDVYWILGEETDMYDLFWEFSVKEKLAKKMLPHFKCPYCGFSDFEMAFRVGVASAYDHELEKLYKTAKKTYHQSFIDLEKHVTDAFSMALNNPLARKIHRELKAGNLRTTEISGRFYRGRKATKKTMTTADLMVPDVGISNEGRYNHAGQSYFYISGNAFTAQLEVQQGDTTPIEIYIQEFEITEPYTKILDLSHEFYEISTTMPPLMVILFSFIEKRKNNKGNYKPDYYLTRFLADCARSEGYEGIKYTSALYHDGYNVVLFGDHSRVKPVGNPKLIKTKEITDD